MAVDLRQVMASILTFSMFIMLGNMIKKDHIDPLFETQPVPNKMNYGVLKASKPGMLKLSELNYGPWKDRDDVVKPCRKKPSLIRNEQSNGNIFFSLTHGPEYHPYQVENAVIVARHLGAKLVVPDIRGTKLGEKRKLGEYYDADNFITTLKEVVHVDQNPPAELSNGSFQVFRVPESVSEDFIMKNIEPFLRKERNLRIVTYFNPSNKTNAKEHKKSMDPHLCQAVYGSLKLNQDLQQVVDSMVGTLRSLSQKMYGRFVAVDFKVEMLEKKGCQESDSSSKRCYNAEEIGQFLKKIGFHPETTIYVTQRGWHASLNGLRNFFPNTLTKDAVMPVYERAKLMDSESNDYEKFIDFFMCKQGDIFVPAIGSRFYTSVVGERIASGKTQIFVPANKKSASAKDYISPYIAKKSHSANTCFC